MSASRPRSRKRPGRVLTTVAIGVVILIAVIIRLGFQAESGDQPASLPLNRVLPTATTAVTADRPEEDADVLARPSLQSATDDHAAPADQTAAEDQAPSDTDAAGLPDRSPSLPPGVAFSVIASEPTAAAPLPVASAPRQPAAPSQGASIVPTVTEARVVAAIPTATDEPPAPSDRLARPESTVVSPTSEPSPTASPSPTLTPLVLRPTLPVRTDEMFSTGPRVPGTTPTSPRPSPTAEPSLPTGSAEQTFPPQLWSRPVYGAPTATPVRPTPRPAYIQPGPPGYGPPGYPGFPPYPGFQGP